MTTSIEAISHQYWEPSWAGGWSLLTASLFAQGYTIQLSKTFGLGYQTVIICAKQDCSKCYYPVNEREKFAAHRIEQVATDQRSLKKFCLLLIARAAALMARCDELAGQQLTVGRWQQYEVQFIEYSNLHITPRHVIDFLPADRFDEFLPILEQVRKDVEPVFKRTEEFCHLVSEQLGTRWSLEPFLVRSLLASEFRHALKIGTVPQRSELELRLVGVGLIATKSEQRLVIGAELKQLEAVLEPPTDTNLLKGNSAFPGKVRGTVRIVLDPSLQSGFNRGEILVTGMTRPDFLPLMQRAVAVITDAGGVLSHAAITARELKLPTIVGVRVATKVLKDGDLVEVDATNGIVRKLTNTAVESNAKNR